MLRDSLNSSLSTLLEDSSDNGVLESKHIDIESFQNESFIESQPTSSFLSDSSPELLKRQTSSFTSSNIPSNFIRSNIPPLELASRDSNSVDDPDDLFKGSIDIDFRSETGQPESLFEETLNEAMINSENTLVERWNQKSDKLRTCQEKKYGEPHQLIDEKGSNKKRSFECGDNKNTINWITIGNQNIAKNLVPKLYVTQKKNFISANKNFTGRNSSKSQLGYSSQFQQKPIGSVIIYPTQSESFRLTHPGSPSDQWQTHHSAPSTRHKNKIKVLSPSWWLQSAPRQHTTAGQLEKQRRQQGYSDQLRFQTMRKAASTSDVNQTTTLLNDDITSKHNDQHQSKVRHDGSRNLVKNEQIDEQNSEKGCQNVSDTRFARLTKHVKQDISSTNDEQLKSNRSGSLSRRDPVINHSNTPEAKDEVEKFKALQKREAMIQYSLKIRDRLLRQIQKQRDNQLNQSEPQEQLQGKANPTDCEKEEKRLPYFDKHIEELIRRHEEDCQRVAAIQSTLKFVL